MALVDNCGARCPQTQFQVNAEGKKMSETFKTIPLQMFSCLSLKHELHIHYLS